MILTYIHNISTAETLIKSASQLAVQLGKNFAVYQAGSQEISPNILPESTQVIEPSSENLSEICEKNDISFLFIQLTVDNGKTIRKMLNDCRELRIPYVFFKDDFQPLQMSKVLVPVNFLEEELEKAQFASAFGRFCQSEIHVLQANDYGSKAAANVQRMKELFDKFEFQVVIEKAKKDSFAVEKEAVERAPDENAGIIIVSASRDYGLDDIIFGSKEYHLIRKSSVPLLLVNPRGDLYALCD